MLSLWHFGVWVRVGDGRRSFHGFQCMWPCLQQSLCARFVVTPGAYRALKRVREGSDE